MSKMRFRLGLRPAPPRGAHDTPQQLYLAGEGTPLTPLGVSILALSAALAPPYLSLPPCPAVFESSPNHTANLLANCHVGRLGSDKHQAAQAVTKMLSPNAPRCGQCLLTIALMCINMDRCEFPVDPKSKHTKDSC